MENKKTILVALAFLTILLSLPMSVRAQTTNIFVYPSTYSPTAAGENFTIDINVTDASQVAGYGLTLHFDPSLLVVTAWQSGGFLEASGIATIGITGGNHSDLGYVSLGDTLSQPGSTSGNGTLAQISFMTRGGGRCALHLTDTSPGAGLLDENQTGITHTTTDGQFIYNYISLTPSNGTAGFMIQGFGFGNNALITSVTWSGTELPIQPTTCDSHGNFVTPAFVPDINATPGNYTISVLDSGGNRKDATFTLTAATGPTGPQGPQGPQGPAGPAGTGGSDAYTWTALILSIVAIIIGIYAVARRKS